jgi:hypothetical protein
MTDQYIAGLFDGEGCIIMRSGVSLGVVMGGCYRPTFAVLHKRFGGRFNVEHAKPGRRAVYRWCLYCGPAQQFLRRIRLYLREKARQAELALLPSFTHGPGKGVLPLRERALRRRVDRALRRLKRQKRFCV